MNINGECISIGKIDETCTTAVLQGIKNKYLIKFPYGITLTVGKTYEICVLDNDVIVL